MSIGITPIGKYIIDFVPKAEVWGDLVSEKESDAVHIDEIVDYLSEIGISRTKKLLKETMSKLVDTNFVRQLPKGEKYYRTQDFDFSQSVDWKDLIVTCIQHMETDFPEHAEEYQKNDLHLCTHPLTGKVENLPMTIQVYGGAI